MSRCSSV